MPSFASPPVTPSDPIHRQAISIVLTEWSVHTLHLSREASDHEALVGRIVAEIQSLTSLDDCVIDTSRSKDIIVLAHPHTTESILAFKDRYDLTLESSPAWPGFYGDEMHGMAELLISHATGMGWLVHL
jgi:hypothetical protein